MKISKRTTGAIAFAATAALLLAGCSGQADNGGSTDETDGGDSGDVLQIATLLPQTGSLGFLMPPVQAGIAKALDDIKAADGIEIEIVADADEGDGNDVSVVEKGADEVIASGAAFVLGAMSSSRTLHVVDQITSAGVLMGSPSNTASELSGISPFFLRTAPPDSVQGNALANQIIADGKSQVAFMAFNDDYSLGLRDTIGTVLSDAGAEIVFGAEGDGNEFPVDQKSFSSEVTAVKASGADAIVVISFDQVNLILPELLAQGLDPANVYLVDGNTVDFSEVVDPGTITGMQGSIPGAQSNDEFKEELKTIYQDQFGEELTSFTYAPEAYDLVNIIALAATKAGATDSESIQAEVANVTGANGGTECTTFADCADLLAGGEDIAYKGKSGTGPLNENNDPSSAYIGIYKYDDTNKPIFQSSVEGAIE